MQVTERADGLVVINDAYNANPESMQAALAALAAIGAGGDGVHGRRRTHAVLGVMAELGPAAATAHRELGAAAALIGVHQLVVVGAAAQGIADGAIEAGLDPARVTVVDETADAAALLTERRWPRRRRAGESLTFRRPAAVAEALLAGATTSNGASR